MRATGSVREAIGGAIGRLGRRRSGSETLQYLAPLTPAETRALLDERARSQLGIDADEFVRRLRARELPDNSVVHSLAMLVGEDRQAAR